jgi:hypothetical protein
MNLTPHSSTIPKTSSISSSDKAIGFSQKISLPALAVSLIICS